MSEFLDNLDTLNKIIKNLREENARLRAEVERLQNYYTELMTTNAAIREGKVSDEERKPTSLKWRKSIYPDLAKVEDWLNKKGYTGEAGAVHVAMDEILELGIESARLIRENKVAFEAVGGVVKANDKLKEENARLRGLLVEAQDYIDDVYDPLYLSIGQEIESIKIAATILEGGNDEN